MDELILKTGKARVEELDRKIVAINPTLTFIGLPYKDQNIDARAIYFQTGMDAHRFDELSESYGREAVDAYNRYGAGWLTYIVAYDYPHICAIRNWRELVSIAHSVVDDWAHVQEKQMRDKQSKLKIADWGHDL